MDINDIQPTNRTLIIVYTTVTDTEDFQERKNRLLDSINRHNTIKAVVVTVVDHGAILYKGTQCIFDPNKLEQLKTKFTMIVEVTSSATHN